MVRAFKMAAITHERSTGWKNWEEWSLVYELIFNSSDSAQQKEGLQLIEVWRSRSHGKLPIAVECTSCVLCAALGQVNDNQNQTYKRLSMAMALVRFVNGMVDQGRSRVRVLLKHLIFNNSRLLSKWKS